MLEDRASSIDSAHSITNPVERVLKNARRVGQEYCWPLSSSGDVVGALGELNQAILGYEIWRLDSAAPTVVEVSEYRTSFAEDWRETVRESVRAATSGLRRRSDMDLWANITWISEGEVK